MGASTDTDEAKKERRAEFAAQLAAAKALRDQLTPAVLQAAFSNFQNTVQDQQRVSELVDQYKITLIEAKVIMQQATISSQEDGDDDSVATAQIWDRAEFLCQLFVDGGHASTDRERHDMKVVRSAVEAGEAPVMVNDRANILASTMLQATNSVTIK